MIRFKKLSPFLFITIIAIFIVIYGLSSPNAQATPNAWETTITPQGSGFEFTGLSPDGYWVEIHTQNTVYCSTDANEVIYTRTRTPPHTNDVDHAIWRPNLPSTAQYDVYAYIPNYSHASNITAQARYKVNHAGGTSLVVVNQNNGKCTWVHLGRYTFNAGTSGNIYLGDYTGDNPWRLLAADGMKFIRYEPSPPTPTPIPETIPPTVIMQLPTNGSVVTSSPVQVAANAQDSGGSGMNRVQFYASYNGQTNLIGTDSTSPYSINWSIPDSVASGTIILSAIAFDNAGNRSPNTSHSYTHISYQKPAQSCEVPYFSQIDSRWKNHPLRTGGYGTCNSYCNTIGRCGCTLTSTAMLIAFYGHDTNPKQLSNCMWGNACPFVWGYAGTRCSGGKAQIARVSGFSWSVLSQEINQNRKPVIVGGKNRRGRQHWVLVISGSGSQAQNYTVHDPATLNGRNVKLSDALSSVTSIRTYHGGQLCNSIMAVPSTVTIPEAVQLPSVVNRSIDLTEQWNIQATSTVTAEVLPYRNEGETSTILIEIPATSPAVTEMLVWSDSQAQGAWQPFYSLVELPLSNEVFVRLREENGDVTDIIPITTTPTNGPIESYRIWLPMIVR